MFKILAVVIGKKSFGKVASSVLGIAVEYSERIRNLFANVDPRSDNNTFAMADGVSKVSILFDGSGLLLTKQFLTLAQIIAECTPASSPSAEGLASFTHRLLVCLADGLNDSKICAELLQPVSDNMRPIVTATFSNFLYLSCGRC